MLQGNCGAVCYSALQCIAVCCGVLQCVAMRYEGIVSAAVHVCIRDVVSVCMCVRVVCVCVCVVGT